MKPRPGLWITCVTGIVAVRKSVLHRTENHSAGCPSCVAFTGALECARVIRGEQTVRVGIILNPIAGGGRLKSRWSEIEASLSCHFGEFTMRETEQSGDAAALAMDFAADGYELIIAAGGDGTASEVADGLLTYWAEHGDAPELGLLPCGTGIDFARGLGLPKGFDDIMKRIAEGKARTIDAGRISYIDDEGRLASRHFINIASLGLSGATDRAVNRDKRKGRVSAKALFLWRTIVEFCRYSFQDVRIRVDDGVPIDARVALVAVCNGRFFGGGMMIAPDAELGDGLFDIVIVRAASKLGLIWDLRLLYGGRHRNHHAITILRGRKVSVEPVDTAEAVLVDIDGEAPGRAPATFELLPNALKLRS